MDIFLLLYTDYVDSLIAEVIALRNKYPSYQKAQVLVNEDIPQNLTDGMQKEAKEVLIENKRSRFSSRR